MRSDQRTFDEIRSFSTILGVISEADGSAEVCQGSTRVVASVVGPTQSRYSRFDVYNNGVIEVDIEISENAECDIMKIELTKFIKNSLGSCVDLNLCPRMVLSIKVLIVNCDGSCLSVALNACVYAILDAGLPFKSGSLTSVSLLWSEKIGFLVDPDLNEEHASDCLFHFAIINENMELTDSSIVCCTCSGVHSATTLKEAVLIALKTAVSFHSLAKKILENSMTLS